MALPTIYWWDRALSFLGRLLPFTATFLGGVAWFYNIVAILIVGSLKLIGEKIQAMDLSWLHGADFSGLTYIALVNSIFPLSETLAMLSAYFTIAVVLVVIRWIKSFIPTISN